MTAFELERPDGGTERLIVRLHGVADLACNPHVAADEFRLLQLLKAAGPPAPTPRFLDPDGELFSRPCLVVGYVEGEPPAAPANAAVVVQLAAALAEIHRVDGSTADLSFLPERIAEVPPSRNRPVLLHGDFWPGNTLWRDGRLVAVIDWEDAAVGDPLADVANARLEVLWALGTVAMEEFTRRYAAAATGLDPAHLPYWDLWADERLASRTADWGLDDATEQAMRAGHEAFVAQALARLPAGEESRLKSQRATSAPQP